MWCGVVVVVVVVVVFLFLPSYGTPFVPCWVGPARFHW
jgi:hypothetical protein